MIRQGGPSVRRHGRSGRARSSGLRWGIPTGRRLLVMVGSLLIVASCSGSDVQRAESRDPNAGPTADTDPGPSRTDDIRYRVEWDMGRAISLGVGVEARGWETINDLGYRVRVTRGYLVSHSAQLTACPDEAEPEAEALGLVPDPAGLGTAPRPGLEKGLGEVSAPETSARRNATTISRWSRILLAQLDPRPRAAFAGHGEDYGPTAVLTSSVESLLLPAPMDFGRLSVKAPLERRYCEAFYLIAAAGPTAQGLPEDVDMVGSSVYVEGFFAREGDAEAGDPTDASPTSDSSPSTGIEAALEGAPETPFRLQTNLANGTIVPVGSTEHLDDGAVGSGSASSTPPERRFEVHIRRDLGAIFDGIDFEAMDDAERVDGLIRALIDATSISVEIG